MPALVLASVISVFVVVSTLTLRLTIPMNNYGNKVNRIEQLNPACYSFFEVSYVAVVLPLGMAVTLMEGSHLLLRFMNFKKAKEEQPQVVNTEE